MLQERGNSMAKCTPSHSWQSEICKSRINGPLKYQRWVKWFAGASREDKLTRLLLYSVAMLLQRHAQHGRHKQRETRAIRFRHSEFTHVVRAIDLNGLTFEIQVRPTQAKQLGRSKAS